MLRKRLRNEEDGELDEEETKTKRGNSKKSKGINFTKLHFIRKYELLTTILLGSLITGIISFSMIIVWHVGKFWFNQPLI